MGRLLKLIGLVVGALVVLVIVAGILVGLLFDPNDYKEQITTAVARATGRELTIEGDLELELFPNLRIATGPASISNADGFAAPVFARIEGASLRVGLLPLLSRNVAVSEARLEGLELNLERDAAGNTNWQDLAGGDAEESSDDAGEGGSSIDAADINLDIDQITIADANVSWRDAGTGSEWLLTDFGLVAEGFGLDRAFPLEIDFRFSGPDIDVGIDSGMNALLDLAANTYRLNGLTVDIEGSGAAWPGGEGEAHLAFNSFTANLDDQSLALEDLVLEVLGLDISGTLQGQQLFDDLSLSGAIAIAEFNPNDLLEVLGTAIETADDSVFRRASAQAEFIYDASQMGMRSTEISLDDSTLTGSLGLFGEQLRFDLAVDSINIDRYLPPAAEGESGEPDEGSVDEVDLPLDPLRTFAADGEFRLGQTQFMGLTMTDARFALAAGDGQLRLTPTASLYGGSLSGLIDIGVEGESASFALVQNLEAVDLNSLARDFLDNEALSGTGNVNLDLTSTGSNVGAIRRALTGSVSFALTEGAWEGIDAWYELRRARAVTQSNDIPEREGAPRTTFDSISASGQVTDGVLTTNDLNATLPFMSLDGAGTVGIFDTTIDIAATAALVDGPVLQSDPEMAGLTGGALPLTVSGTLAELSIRPDFGALIRAEISNAVNERVEEEREELREEVQDRVRDRLRNIFDRD